MHEPNIVLDKVLLCAYSSHACLLVSGALTGLHLASADPCRTCRPANPKKQSVSAWIYCTKSCTKHGHAACQCSFIHFGHARTLRVLSALCDVNGVPALPIHTSSPMPSPPHSRTSPVETVGSEEKSRRGMMGSDW